MRGMIAAGALLCSAALHAQQPPARPDSGTVPATGTRIGLFGFGVRAGVDFTGGSQMVFGTTLDLGDIATSRVRLRPSAELGVFNGVNTYVTSAEVLYRFTDDSPPAIPYIGVGASVAGHTGCAQDSSCPAVWVNLVFGFELHYQTSFNWLLEYHGMDAMRRHRLYIGLTTRRGN